MTVLQDKCCVAAPNMLLRALNRIARYNAVTHRKGTTWRKARETMVLAIALRRRPFGESGLGVKHRFSPTSTAGNMIAVSLARSAAKYAATEAANQDRM